MLNEIKTLELLILPETYAQLSGDDFAAVESLRDHPRLRQLGSEAQPGLDHTTTRSKEEFWRAWDREQAPFAALRKSGCNFKLSRLSGGMYRLAIETQPLDDLSMLGGTPIGELWLNGCKVADLAPIRDLPLRVLGLHGNPVSDLGPLREMPLEELSLEGTRVADLSPLTGLRLKKLYLHDCERLTDIGPLARIQTLEKLTVPAHASDIEALRSLPNLKWLAFAMQDRPPYFPVSTAKEFWEEFGRLRWVRELRETGPTPRKLKQLGDGTWEVDFDRVPIADLSPLKGASISILWLQETGVSDLGPLRGMPLTSIHLYKDPVTDLGPLRGMSLEFLNLVSTKVSDISALRGMPLTSLRLDGCAELTDISPLAESKKLRMLTLPAGAKDIEFLRNFPALERLGYKEDPKNGWLPDKTAAEFWREYDAAKE